MTTSPGDPTMRIAGAMPDRPQGPALTFTADVIILQRVEDGEPEHCVHGRATCCVCNAWCWIGSESLKLLNEQMYLPICHQCASSIVPLDREADGNAGDHRRADGPHD